MASNKPADFASELSRLMDKHEVDEATVWAALRRRANRAREKSHTADIIMVIEIARAAEGVRDSLQDFIDGKYTRDYEMEKVKPCTTAKMLADFVRGNSNPSKIERLRRKFRKDEKNYRNFAIVYTSILYVAFHWRYYTWNMTEEEQLELIRYFSQLISEYPTLSWFFFNILLPQLSRFRDELRERVREIDREIAQLLHRREELETIQRWHAIAHWEGLAVSEGTGQKQLQEANDGINALRNAS